MELQDIIEESDSRDNKIVDVLVAFLKEKYMIKKNGWDSTKHMVFRRADSRLYIRTVIEGYNEIHKERIGGFYHCDLYRFSSLANEKINKELFNVTSNSYGVPSIGINI